MCTFFYFDGNLATKTRVSKNRLHERHLTLINTGIILRHTLRHLERHFVCMKWVKRYLVNRSICKMHTKRCCEIILSVKFKWRSCNLPQILSTLPNHTVSRSWFSAKTCWIKICFFPKLTVTCFLQGGRKSKPLPNYQKIVLPDMQHSHKRHIQ